MSQAVFSLLDKNEDILAKRALKRVIVYIEGHLSEDLSLTRLADVGGFNASYFSRLFKQITGETVKDGAGEKAFKGQRREDPADRGKDRLYFSPVLYQDFS